MRIDARLLAAVALGLPAFAHADSDPNEYVNTPLVEYGEREIDTKYGTRYFDEAQERESAGSIGLGYGATQWWFTEAYVKYHKDPGDRTRYDEFEWENKFQLTETNKYPADVGFLVETEVPRAREEGRFIVIMGPLVQWDTGPLRWNTNVFLERASQPVSEEPNETELSYQAQVTYHLHNGLDVGAQAFGDLGQWNEWLPHDAQSHRIGPVVYGKVKLEGRQEIEWNAAWLFGLTKATADNGFRLQAEYEF
ncbi:MAG TPA: hypothetical protein VLY46_07650 [Usitatibacter sp.]|nr:hypothetical protein [Usitatibacter sp.]